MKLRGTGRKTREKFEEKRTLTDNETNVKVKVRVRIRERKSDIEVRKRESPSELVRRESSCCVSRRVGWSLATGLAGFRRRAGDALLWWLLHRDELLSSGWKGRMG